MVYVETLVVAMNAIASEAGKENIAKTRLTTARISHANMVESVNLF